jgi:hypothetical protein
MARRRYMMARRLKAPGGRQLSAAKHTPAATSWGVLARTKERLVESAPPVKVSAVG